MAAKKKAKAKQAAQRPATSVTKSSPAGLKIAEPLREFLKSTSIPRGFVNPKKTSRKDLRERLLTLNLRPTVAIEKLLNSVNRIKPAGVPTEKMPDEVRASVRALKPELRRFHGAKIALWWFPFPTTTSPCADQFGYMSSAATRNATKLPFNVTTQALLGQLGNLMGDSGREPNQGSNNPSDAGVSTIPAGYTYFGQFVDHDITLDVSSSLDVATDANTINNMRSPAVDLDSVYGRGPGLDPFLYEFPASGLPATAIKLQTGTNTNVGPGGPSGNGSPGGMVTQTRFDVPRIPLSNTAVIGGIPKELAMPCPLGRPSARPRRRLRVARMAIIPVKPGSRSSSFARTLSIFRALLRMGTRKPVSKKALKSTTQLERIGSSGLRLNWKTCAIEAVGKLKFTQ